MKANKFLLTALLALALPLAGCNSGGNGGGTDPSGGGGQGGGGGTDPKEDTALVKQIKNFLTDRGVTGLESIPYFGDVATDNLIEVNEEDDYWDPFEGTEFEGYLIYAPSIDLVVKGDVTAALSAGFAAAKWTSVVEDGYNYFDEGTTTYTDPTEQVKVNAYYETDAEYTVGTHVSICAADDLLTYHTFDVTEWSDISALITAFLSDRGVNNFTVPALAVTASDIDYVVTTTPLYYDAPFFEISFTSSTKVQSYVDILKTAGWTVPTKQTEYGYECVDPTKKVEIDCFSGTYEGEVYNTITVYAVADITEGGGGGEEELDIPQALIDEAKAIATIVNGDEIYSDYYYEEDYALYVFGTYEGDSEKLAEAITNTCVKLTNYDALGDGPQRQTIDGAVCYTQQFEHKTEDFGLDVMSYIDEDDENLITVQIAIYFVYGPDDDTIENPDGSFTTTFDFSNMADQTTITEVTSSNGAITLTSEKAKESNDTKYFTNGESLRIYWGATITFTASEGKEILKVEFTCTEGNSKTFYPDDSSLSITNGSYTVVDKDVTITANSGASSVAFTVNGTKGNIAITSISVTYK